MSYHDPNQDKHFADRVENKVHVVPANGSAAVETRSELRVTTPPEVCGMGHRMKRKEDPRFLRGKGNYVDDIKLPGMLYMDIVRSPYAHARITNIDPSAALAIPAARIHRAQSLLDFDRSPNINDTTLEAADERFRIAGVRFVWCVPRRAPCCRVRGAT